MMNQPEPAAIEKIYHELGVARDEVKRIIATRSSFEAMPLLQRLMCISQRAQGHKRHELTYLDRGSPHHRWSRPSNEGLEIGRILEFAVGHAHLDDSVLNNLEKLIVANNPRKIVKTLKHVLLKYEDSTTVHEVFGNQDIGGFEKGTFNRVIQYLLDKSGVSPSCRDKLETQLLEEIITFAEGIPYGPSSGLQLAKIALGDLLRGSTEKLNDRPLGENERLPHLDNVLVTQGVSEALNWLFGRSGYFKKGDMVIGTVPFYAAYNTLLEEEGIELIPLPTKNSGELDLGAINKLYTDIGTLSEPTKNRIRGDIIINPSNPTGHVFLEHEMRAHARLAEVAPKMIFIQDVVYQLYANGEVKFMEQVVPRLPCFTTTSYSKAQRRASARLGGMTATESTDRLFAQEGLTDKIIGTNKTVIALADMNKGGAASHTTQASPIAQVKTVFSGTYDLITGNISESRKNLATTRNAVMNLLRMSTQEREKDCPYYVLVDVHGYVRDNLFNPEEQQLCSYVLQRLDVPEIILRAIEQNHDLVFDAASFFPLNGMPDFLRASGYQALYQSKLTSPPSGYIRMALPNTSSDEFIKATNRLIKVIHDRVDELKESYATSITTGSLTTSGAVR